MTEPETVNTSISRDRGSQTEVGPRIYVACLAPYSEAGQQSVQWTDCSTNGQLHGRWIDADQDAEAIQAGISEMLAASPIPLAEEWAIHDHEGFEGAKIEEFSSIERVAALAVFVAEHGELGGRLLQHFGSDLDDATAAFAEYAGEHKSLADFAQDVTVETTEIPENLANYIDYRAIARDMEFNGDVFVIELGFEDVHVFWSR